MCLRKSFGVCEIFIGEQINITNVYQANNYCCRAEVTNIFLGQMPVFSNQGFENCLCLKEIIFFKNTNKITDLLHYFY